MKIYEKDGAVYAEHEGWMVCAVEDSLKNPWAKYNWIVLKSPSGELDYTTNIESQLPKLGFPELSPGTPYKDYHQTLRDLMEKPYGHAGEWERFCPRDSGYFKACYKCQTGNILTMYRRKEHTLCRECFEKHVPPAPAEKRPIDPAETNDDLCISGKYLPDGDSCFHGEVTIKRPIDPAEVDETWIGATVEAINTVPRVFDAGNIYTVKRLEIQSEMRFKLEEIDDCWAPPVVNFTLVKKAERHQNTEENRAIHRECMEQMANYEPQQNSTETTHSAELEFPNGQRVEIPPPPESEGWKAKVLWDVSEWPHRYDSEYRDSDFEVTHESGELIAVEYEARMAAENPRIVSMTKWTREVSENTLERINQYREQLEYHKTIVSKRYVNSTWPERHPPGPVKYDNNQTKEK